MKIINAISIRVLRFKNVCWLTLHPKEVMQKIFGLQLGITIKLLHCVILQAVVMFVLRYINYVKHDEFNDGFCMLCIP